MLKTEKNKIIEEVLKNDVCYNGHSTECLRNKIEKALQSQNQKIIEEIEKLREPLADLEHQQWMEWSKNICNNERISEDRLDKWAHLWKDYKKLSQEQKNKDRVWADKVIELLNSLGEKNNDN
jgi:hypothetical protein